MEPGIRILPQRKSANDSCGRTRTQENGFSRIGFTLRKRKEVVPVDKNFEVVCETREATCMCFWDAEKDHRLVVHHGIDAKNLGWSLAVGVRGAYDARGHQSQAPSALLSIHPNRMSDRVLKFPRRGAPNASDVVFLSGPRNSFS